MRLNCTEVRKINIDIPVDATPDTIVEFSGKEMPLKDIRPNSVNQLTFENGHNIPQMVDWLYSDILLPSECYYPTPIEVCQEMLPAPDVSYRDLNSLTATAALYPAGSELASRLVAHIEDLDRISAWAAVGYMHKQIKNLKTLLLVYLLDVPPTATPGWTGELKVHGVKHDAEQKTAMVVPLESPDRTCFGVYSKHEQEDGAVLEYLVGERNSYEAAIRLATHWDRRDGVVKRAMAASAIEVLLGENATE